MNVRELIEFLSAYSGDLKVFLSRDSEGNRYHPFTGEYAITNMTVDNFGEPDFETDGDENSLILFPSEIAG